MKSPLYGKGAVFNLKSGRNCGNCFGIRCYILISVDDILFIKFLTSMQCLFIVAKYTKVLKKYRGRECKDRMYVNSPFAVKWRICRLLVNISKR